MILKFCQTYMRIYFITSEKKSLVYGASWTMVSWSEILQSEYSSNVLASPGCEFILSRLKKSWRLASFEPQSVEVEYYEASVLPLS